MRITITGINFVYDDGYDKEYTGVELQYVASGIEYTRRNNVINVSKEQYEENKSSTNGLRRIIVDNILEEVTNHVDVLNEYKDSLNAN